jgi:transposase
LQEWSKGQLSTWSDAVSSVWSPHQGTNRLPQQLLTDFLGTHVRIPGYFYRHTPAEDSILGSNTAVADGIEPSLDATRQQLVELDVGHSDESGLRVEGHLNWLHVASTNLLTYYGVHPKRSRECMKALGVLPAFRGRAVHDCWQSYFTFDNCQHALCNARILRDLLFIVEQYEQSWAENMSELLFDIKTEVDVAPVDQTSLSPELLAHFQQCYDKLISQGLAADPPPKKRGRREQSAPKNLLNRLQERKSKILAFIYDFRVPLDDNLAERDVRMVKIKQKVSGTFRTRSGAETFCAIHSYISTARKHGLNVIDAIYDALTGSSFMPSSAAGVA